MGPGSTFHAAAWQALTQAWNDVQAHGRTAAALLTGEVGVGKSWMQVQWARQLRPDQVLIGSTPFLVRIEDLLGQDLSRPDRVQGAAAGLADLARRAGGICLTVDSLDVWPEDDLGQLERLWHHLTRLSAPVLLLGTARETPEQVWQDWLAAATLTGQPGPRDLPLKALPPAQVEVLLREALRGVPPPELLTWLDAQGDHRAGVILDTLRQVIHEGGLRREGSTWVFHGGVEVPSAPGGADLPLLALAGEPEVLSVLATLAVAGRSLSTEEWAVRCGGGPTFELARRRAQALGLVRPVALDPTVSWALSSPGLSRAVLGQLSLAQVRELHARALSLETRTGLRALHARLCGEVNLPLIQRAAFEALREGRRQEALDHLQFLHGRAPGHARSRAWLLMSARIRWTQGRLLESLSLLEGAALRDAGRSAQVLRAQVLRDLGRQREAADLLRVASRPAELCLLALTLRELDRAAEGEEIVRRALEDSSGAAAAYARAVLARLLFTRGAYGDARREGELAVRTLRRSGGVPFVRALMWLAATLDHLGQHREAATSLQEAQEEAARIGDHHSRVMVLTSLAITRLSTCDLRDAERAALTSISLCRSRRYLPQLAAGWHNLGMVAWLRGDPGGAARHFMQSWRVGRQAGRPLWALNASAFRALCLALQGDQRLARAVLRDPRTPQAFRTTGVIAAYLHLLTGDPRGALAGLADWDTPGNAWLQAEGHVLRGHAQVRLQDWNAAQVSFEEAARVAQSGPVPPMLAQALVGLATLRALQGDRSAARTLAVQAHELAREHDLGGITDLTHSVHVEARSGGLLDFSDAHPASGASRRLRTLGRFTVEDGGETLPWRGRTTRRLLALLLAGHLGGRPALLTRDGLCLHLWPDVPDSVAYGNLRKSISRLKVQLGGAASIRVTVQGTFELSLSQVDVQAFLDAAHAGLDQEALRAYGGPFLPEEDHPEVTLLRLHLQGLWRAAILRTAKGLAPAEGLQVLWPLLLDDPADDAASVLAARALRDLPDRAASFQWLRRWQTILDAENAPYPQDLLGLHHLLSAAD